MLEYGLEADFDSSLDYGYVVLLVEVRDEVGGIPVLCFMLPLALVAYTGFFAATLEFYLAMRADPGL